MGIWRFKDYKDKAGKKALSVEIYVKDMPGAQNDFPAELRATANRGAAIIGDALNEIAASQRIERELVVGARLDPRKRHNVGVAMRRGMVDATELRPYQRRSTQTELPKIALVSSCGVLEVNSDPGFLRRTTALTLAVAWACEIVGADVTAVMMEGHGLDFLSARQPYRTAQLAYVLYETGHFTNLQAYTVAFNRDRFYGQAYGPAVESDREAWRKMAALRGRTLDTCAPLSTFPGLNGGQGVNWAHNHLQADIVIGIGNLTDLQDADIRLGNQFSIPDACEAIAAQARKISLKNR